MPLNISYHLINLHNFTHLKFFFPWCLFPSFYPSFPSLHASDRLIWFLCTFSERKTLPSPHLHLRRGNMSKGGVEVDTRPGFIKHHFTVLASPGDLICMQRGSKVKGQAEDSRSLTTYPGYATSLVESRCLLQNAAGEGTELAWFAKEPVCILLPVRNNLSDQSVRLWEY